MNVASAVRALGPIDLRSVARDPLLRWVALLPLGLALLIRSVMPALFQRLALWIDYDLMPHYDALTGYALLLLLPNVIGVVIGFLLLDQNDDRTLSALRVTPLPLVGYLAWRLGVPMGVSLLLTPPAFWIAGVRTGGPGFALALVAAAPLAPMFAVLIAAFARNKVQGFALMKALGGVTWPPLIAYFVDPPLEWLVGGLFPTWWPGKVYWQVLSGATPWGWLAGGLIWQGLLLAWLLRRYLSRAPEA